MEEGELSRRVRGKCGEMDVCGGADGTGFSWLDSRTDDGGGESVFGLHCAQETDETKC